MPPSFAFFIYVSFYVSTLLLVLLGGEGGSAEATDRGNSTGNSKAPPFGSESRACQLTPPPTQPPRPVWTSIVHWPNQAERAANDINAKRSLKIPRFRDVTTSANRYSHMRSARCVASICIEGVQTCVSKSVNVAVFCVSAVLQSHTLASVDSPLSSRVWLRCDSPAP